MYCYRAEDWCRETDQKVRAMCSVFLSVTHAAVKRKQKSLSREQFDRFDEAHARKFKSASRPLKCSHRSDEKLRLNTSQK